PPSVQRVTGNQVEDPEAEINVAEPYKHGHDWCRRVNARSPAAQPGRTQAYTAYRTTGKGADDRHPELGPCVGGISFNLRYASEREQGYGTDRQIVRFCDERVRELMQQQRDKEKQRRDNGE